MCIKTELLICYLWLAAMDSRFHAGNQTPKALQREEQNPKHELMCVTVYCQSDEVVCVNVCVCVWGGGH